MHSKIHRIVFGSILMLAATVVAGSDLPFVGAPPETPRVSAFATEPAVVKAGTGYEVRFAVKSETDVTIEIVDAQNKVVRHLASGVLGANAPEPFKSGSLAQAVVWDGKDDHGKDVAGSCKARVGLGLKPALDKVFGGSGQNVGNAISLAAGKDGTLYYMYVAGEGHHTAGENFICAFDRNGKFLRQLMPMPANLSREQVAGTGALPVGESQWMPILYHGLVHTLYPDVTGCDRQGMAVGANKLYFVGNDGSGKMTLLRLGLDGSAGKDFVGPVIGDSFMGCSLHLALSPDGKYVYASGLIGSGRWGYKPLHNVVYRGEAEGSKPFEKFIGEYGKSGTDGLLNDPRGLAVDKDGNIYVAECTGNRISVWSPQGKMIGSISVPSPDMVAVHPKSGAVYVLSSPTTVPPGVEAFLGGSAWFPKKKLLKFNTYKDSKEASSFPFPEAKLSGGKAVMALDASVEPPVVWVGSWAYGVQCGAKKIVDNGSTLELAGDPIRDLCKDKFPFTNPKHMSVDRHDTELTVNGFRFNPVSGECLGALPYSQKFHTTIGRYEFGEETLSPNGDFLIHRSGMGQVVKLKPDASAFDPFGDGSPFAEPGSSGPECKCTKLFGGFMHPRGVDVAGDNEIFVVHHQDHFRNRHMTAVSEVGLDGQIKRYEYIKLDGPSACVRVDSKGNTYLGTTVRPADESAPNQRIDEGKAKWSSAYDPKSVRGKIPEINGSWFLTPGFWYTMCTGSIVKFGRDGGKVSRGSGPLLMGTDTGGDIAWIMPGSVEGGKWAYFGCSPMPYKGAGATAGGCLCETARFDIDGHDRLYVPEAMRFSIAVLDANGNFICRFGSYGNLDSRGKGSPVPEPEIPFGWPMAVAVSDTAAYVGDHTNFRVMKVKLDYTAEKVLSVK
jgi:DNA-binding beta-propeller fold protein YncE